MMMNKKGTVVLMLVALGVILSTAAFFIYLREAKITNFVGDLPLGIVGEYLKTEKGLIAVDQAAKYSAHKSINDLAAKGGFSDTPACGKYFGYTSWTAEGKEPCQPDLKAAENLGKAISENIFLYNAELLGRAQGYTIVSLQTPDGLRIVGNPTGIFVPDQSFQTGEFRPNALSCNGEDLSKLGSVPDNLFIKHCSKYLNIFIKQLGQQGVSNLFDPLLIVAIAKTESDCTPASEPKGDAGGILQVEYACKNQSKCTSLDLEVLYGVKEFSEKYSGITKIGLPAEDTMYFSLFAYNRGLQPAQEAASAYKSLSSTERTPEARKRLVSDSCAKYYGPGTKWENAFNKAKAKDSVEYYCTKIGDVYADTVLSRFKDTCSAVGGTVGAQEEESGKVPEPSTGPIPAPAPTPNPVLQNVKSVDAYYWDTQSNSAKKFSKYAILADEAADSYTKLKSDVESQGGKIYITSAADMYRTYEIQQKCYDEYLASLKTPTPRARCNPPGGSWHVAARAFDVDVDRLNLDPDRCKSLQKFKDIAKKDGWNNIVDCCNCKEEWHFEYYGKFADCFVQAGCDKSNIGCSKGQASCAADAINDIRPGFKPPAASSSVEDLRDKQLPASSAITQIISPGFDINVDYNINEYQDLWNTASNFPSLLGPCLGVEDSLMCVGNVVKSLNKKDSKFIWSTDCSKGNDYALNGMLEFVDDCSKSTNGNAAGDDCACTYDPVKSRLGQIGYRIEFEPIADDLKANVYSTEPTLTNTIKNNFATIPTKMIITSGTALFETDILTKDGNSATIKGDSFYIAKRNGKIEIVELKDTKALKKCSIAKKDFKFCATSTYKTLSFNPGTSKAQQADIVYKFALHIEKTTPPPPVEGLKFQDKPKAEKQGYLSWDENPDVVGSGSYQVFVRATDFQPSTTDSKYKSVEGIDKTVEFDVKDIASDHTFKQFSENNLFDTKTDKGVVTYTVLDADGNQKTLSKFDDKPYKFLAIKEDAPNKIMISLSGLTDGLNNYFAVVAVDFQNAKDLSRVNSLAAKPVDDLAPGSPTVSVRKENNKFLADITAPTKNEDGSDIDEHEKMQIDYFVERLTGSKCEFDTGKLKSKVDSITELHKGDNQKDVELQGDLNNPQCFAFVAVDSSNNPSTGSNDAERLAAVYGPVS